MDSIRFDSIASLILWSLSVSMTKNRFFLLSRDLRSKDTFCNQRNVRMVKIWIRLMELCSNSIAMCCFFSLSFPSHLFIHGHPLNSSLVSWFDFIHVTTTNRLSTAEHLKIINAIVLNEVKCIHTQYVYQMVASSLLLF